MQRKQKIFMSSCSDNVPAEACCIVVSVGCRDLRACMTRLVGTEKHALFIEETKPSSPSDGTHAMAIICVDSVGVLPLISPFVA